MGADESGRRKRGTVRDGTRKRWAPSFSCGHVKRREHCATCVAERPKRSRSLAERLAEKIDKNGPVPAHRPELGPCHMWTGAVDQNGRAQIYWNGRVQPASRAVWFVTTGEEMPPGILACHSCDNPPCCNPDHIFPGDAGVNQRDCVAKGRRVYGGRGRPLTDEERVRVVARFVDGVSMCRLAVEFGVSRRTIARQLEVAGVYQFKRTA
jgi:hypothetical protein